MNKNYDSLTQFDFICFSHLRWNFVFQRPQHLMSRCSKLSRTFYVEEPIFSNEPDHCRYALQGSIGIVTPVLSEESPGQNIADRQEVLLRDFFLSQSITKYIFWYYTPMALSFSRSFKPALVIYDCMDELSAFKFAPPELTELENEMFRKADLVFTGGRSLFEHKKARHHNIYPLPSSIDKEHFAGARNIETDAAEQQAIPHPRFGYYGVIDERFDNELIDQVAAQKPDWQFVFVGPVVKVNPESLPQRSNIHYLGAKTYDELPAYIAGWDIALIPFARNESTEFISPTKTPEYLAAGKAVISTSIRDVIDPYSVNGLVKIADDPKGFISVAELILANGMGEKWLASVDDFLAGNSWDKTWTSMLQLINLTLEEKKKLFIAKKEHYV